MWAGSRCSLGDPWVGLGGAMWAGSRCCLGDPPVGLGCARPAEHFSIRIEKCWWVAPGPLLAFLGPLFGPLGLLLGRSCSLLAALGSLLGLIGGGKDFGSDALMQLWFVVLSLKGMCSDHRTGSG